MTGAARLRFLLAFGGAAVAVSVLVFAVTATSDHVGGRIPAAALEVGDRALVHRLRAARLAAPPREQHRPSARRHRLRLGCRNAEQRQQRHPATPSAAVLGALVIAVFAHLLLAYPSGELRSRFERRLVTAGYTLALVANVRRAARRPEPAVRQLPDERAVRARQVPARRTSSSSSPTSSRSRCSSASAVLMVRHWRAASTAARRGLGSILASGGWRRAADRGLVRRRSRLQGTAGRPHHARAAGVRDGAVLLRRRSLRSRLARGGLADLLVDVTRVVVGRRRRGVASAGARRSEPATRGLVPRAQPVHRR